MKPVPDFENDPNLTEQQKRRRREYYANREENIRKTNEWQRANPDRVRISRARNAMKDKSKWGQYRRDWAKRWAKDNSEALKKFRRGDVFKGYMRKHLLRKKAEVISAYGGHCACCGETQIEFLCLDHINNDGAEKRRSGEHKIGSGLYRQLKKQGYPKGHFQVLCHNCNGAKGYYGYCPHDVEARRLIGLTVDIVRVKRPRSVA